MLGAKDGPRLRTTPHVLLAGVKTLELETDYEGEDWSLRMPYDNFVLTLARTGDGEGALSVGGGSDRGATGPCRSAGR